MSTSGDLSLINGRNYMHPNPMFDLMSGWVPHRLKDMFRWCEYMYYNSAQIYLAAKKQASYVVTDVIVAAEEDSTKENYNRLVKKRLRLKEKLVTICMNLKVYGNVFVSTYVPHIRSVHCTACNTSTPLQKVQYKYTSKTMMVAWTCPECSAHYTQHIEDLQSTPSKDETEIQTVFWDPKCIEIDHNPVTGEREYWYDIPPDVRDKINRGDPMYISKMPKGFLEAVSRREMFKFNQNQIYHLHTPTLAGLDSAWGYPPMVSALKTFYNIAVLTRANEAIALDHLIPFRIISPRQTIGSVDPAQMLNMRRWSDEVREGYADYRNDPLHILFAPVGVDVSQINGQGRALLTLAEVEARENTLLAIMGIPRELAYGGLAVQATPIALRMFENDTLAETNQIMECGQWILDRCAEILSWKQVTLDMVPFKFIDDVAQKAARVQIGTSLGILSMTTIAEENEIDLEKERDRQYNEALENVRLQDRIQRDSAKLQNDLAAQAKSEAEAGQQAGMMPGMNYDPMAVMAQADQIAQQLSQLDEGSRRMQTDKLQAEDGVMYACVIQALERLRLDQENQMLMQGRQSGQVM